ncbi:c-type cytochrome [Pseudohongiella sp. O18]|uniref:c-type cytochrome n=1 Tax=Pseudohongiella sp. O18 TaxID=2904248 RepID=UPI001F2B5850|nr:cytochrome c [Pseudohongiella sp. O18]
MLKKVFAIGTLVLSSVLVVTVSAQQDEPTPQERAAASTETRQAVFKLLAFNMAPISGMARGAEFDAALAERNARRIAELAPMIPEVFAANDTREFTVETEALPIIWDNMSDFEQKASELQAAALTFADVASGGDRNTTIAAVRAFGSTCGNCHREYRVD